MSEPRHRKLTAMGIAALVSTARAEVLSRIPGEIFNLWLDVFGELKEAEDQAALRQEAEWVNRNSLENCTNRLFNLPSDEPPSPTNLVRFWELDKPPTSYFRETEGTPEYARRQAVSIKLVFNYPHNTHIFASQVYNQDPIRVMQLAPFVGAQIREAESNCGPANFKTYLDRTDPTVLKQIQEVLARG